MSENCNLCLQTKNVTIFKYYSRDSPDTVTGNFIDNVYICDTCVIDIQDDIFILPLEEGAELENIPFRLLPEKRLSFKNIPEPEPEPTIEPEPEPEIIQN